MIGGIYKIQSISKPYKFYIGSTVCFKRRKGEHFRDLRRGDHPGHKLQRHFNKYGQSDLEFIELETCTPCDLIAREQHYFSTLVPTLNINRTAGGRYTGTQSEGTKALRASRIRGRKWTDAQRIAFKRVAKDTAGKRYPVPNTIHGYTLINSDKRTDDRKRICVWKCNQCNVLVERTVGEMKAKQFHCRCRVSSIVR
jgi:group I intron endonuclease